jgi:hypothetical protein
MSIVKGLANVWTLQNRDIAPKQTSCPGPDGDSSFSAPWKAKVQPNSAPVKDRHGQHDHDEEKRRTPRGTV